MEQSSDGPPGSGAAYLLVLVGYHAARHFGEQLAPLGIEPRHFGLLRLVAAAEGQSQQALAERLRLPKSRMVWMVDDLEEQGLVERRRNPTDRRAHALYLTEKGRKILEKAGGVAARHEAELLKALQPEERSELAALLRRLAADQGVLDNALPGPPPGVKPKGRG
jgi:DNA-binding MarR family transcriptional regulator